MAFGDWLLACVDWVRFVKAAFGFWRLAVGRGEIGFVSLFLGVGFWRLIGTGWGTPPVEPGGYIGGCPPAAGNCSLGGHGLLLPLFLVLLIPH